MEATLKVDTKKVINRMKEFNKKLIALCDEYGLETHFASDDETNEKYIVIDIKDFIKEEDINMNIEK